MQHIVLFVLFYSPSCSVFRHNKQLKADDLSRSEVQSMPHTTT